MQDSIRDTLAGLIKKYGTSLVDDPRRLEGLLRDLCGENKREINALIGALKLKVPADLLNTSSSPIEILSVRLIKRIEDDLGMKEELARWAVESWAAALGKLSNALQQMHPQKKEAGVAFDTRVSQRDLHPASVPKMPVKSPKVNNQI